MQYFREDVALFLKEAEKRLNLNLSDFNWMEDLLLRVKEEGFECGQSSRSDKDYDEGYRDGKRFAD